jgi:TetR/AcrR family transcriptional regulator
MAKEPTRIQRANRELILAAALPVFSADGFKGATVDRIAAAAGMSKPNLLYYFRRKDDIYAAVLERTLDAWLEPLEALDPSGEPEAELARYIRIKLRMSLEAPDASRLFANEVLHGAPVIGDVLRGRLRRLVAEKAAVIGGWMESGRLHRMDPTHLIFMIWAMTQHYADFAVQVEAITGPCAHTPGGAAVAADTILTLVLRSLRTGRA